MQIKRIDHLVITVKDINTSVNFYTTILNMQELTLRGKNVEIKALRFGDQRLHIHLAGKEVEPKALKATPGSTDICLVTDTAITEVVKHLIKHNITIEKEPTIISGTLGEMESVWFRDPDGNLIEVAHYKID
ncbi:Virulence protein [Legionella massiliensis]|uniref:Virulence protein n=1 Tax=Legionella massiliensis TaxID=1034943 RepID=A0A078KUI2_9GAMM|nr:VOC family protein [Legionella massiliensis]CDZ76662.1 Virulence protein [Legionella massiliensis]CEE12400.1 Virulence protein [Legionella massiliensis]